MAGELHWLKFTPLLPKEQDPFFEFIFFVAQPVFAAGCLTLLSQTNAIQKYVDFLQNRDLRQAKDKGDLAELNSILRQHAVLRVSAQDHYLEVVCADQKFLVRGRMTDVMSVLAQCEGVQIHRSHWVANRHVKQIRRSGRGTKLLLSDGTEVPVAKSRNQWVSQLSE
jgi:DNA-binding LytR/AlgR family response regulator